MMRRLLLLLVLLFACSPGGAQQPDPRTDLSLPTSFHDGALNITFFYPSHFVPGSAGEVIAGPGGLSDPSAWVETRLRTTSTAWAGSSFFLVSSIDEKCPDLLREAALPGPWVRAQILRQLTPLGTPAITQEPLRYMIHGHAAYIVMASAQTPATIEQAAHTIYAVKSCALGSVSSGSSRKSQPNELISHIFCSDFTTQNSNLLSMMFSFVIQFGDDPPEPLFLPNAYPRH